MIHVIVFNALFACCLIYSLRYGGGPEKAAVLFEAAAVILTIIAVVFLPGAASFSGLPLALAAIDVALLVALTCIALRANRLWPIGLAGLQLSTVIVHASKVAFPELPAASYAIFEQFWSWPILMTTAWGTQRHQARVKRHGPERDWKPLWPQLAQAGSTA